MATAGQKGRSVWIAVYVPLSHFTHIRSFILENSFYTLKNDHRSDIFASQKFDYRLLRFTFLLVTNNHIHTQ